MLLILLLGQGAAPAVGLDVSAVLGDLYSQLNATGPGDLVHWTEDELYTYADAAAQRLAALTPLFVYYDGAVAVTTGWAEIALPARHLATIHVLADIGIAGLRPLREATVEELEALDDTWRSTSGEVEAYTQNAEGLQQLVLYREPDADGRLAWVWAEFPTTIAALTPTVAAPTALTEYFGFAVLAGARGKESVAQMPDVAAQAKAWMALIETVAMAYWGTL